MATAARCLVLLFLLTCQLHAQALRKSWGNIKPPYGTLLDPSNLLSRGLRIAIPFNDPVMSMDANADATSIRNYGTWPIGDVLTAGNPGTLRGPRYTGDVPGFVPVGRKGGGTRMGIDYRWAIYLSITGTNSIDWIPLSGGCTLLFSWQKRDATARYPIIFTAPVAAGSEFGGLVRYTGIGTRFYFGGQVEGTNIITLASPAGDGLTEERWVFSTGPRGMEIWQNGLIAASNSANPSRISNLGTISEFRIGYGTANESEHVTLDFFYIWARQLSTTEIKYVTQFPFDMFSPPPNWLSIASVAGAAGGNFTIFHGGAK